MKYILTIIILILFSTILNASYLRSIRIGAFSTDQKAQESLVRLEKYFKSNENLVKLQKKHKFELKVRKSGKYYATLIEPLRSRVVLQEVLDTLRVKYKDAYVTKLKLEPTSEQVIKRVPKTVIKKEIIIVPEVIEIKKTEEKTEIIAPKMIEPKIEKKKLQEKVIKPIMAVKSKIIEKKKPEIKEKSIQDGSSKNQAAIYLLITLLFISLFIILVLIVKLFKNKNKKKKKQYIENEIGYKKKLEQIKKKDIFLMHSNNELKTLMIAIKSLTHNVLEDDISFITKDSIQRVKSIATNSIKNIDDILNISEVKIGDFEIEKREFNINDVIDYVLTISIMQARDKNINITLESEVPSLIIGDSFRLAQVLTNILSHSIALTKEENISLNIMQVSRYKDIVKLEFLISDIGITDYELETIFKDDFGAKALGVSKKLIEMMDGEITVDTKMDDRTTFSFSIVFKLADPDNRRQYRLPSSNFLNKKVLIVDSSTQNILALKKRLDYFKYKVDSINSFEDLDFKDDEKYDLVVLSQSKLSSFSIRKIKEMQTSGSKTVILSKLYTKVKDNFIYDISLDAELKTPFTQQRVLDMIIELDLSKNLNDKHNLKEKLKELAGKKILVADDNQLNQEMIRDLLSGTGIDVKFVLNGETAVSLVTRDEKFDLILMDINMSKLNGYEAAKEIRKDKTYNNVKILALLSDEIESAIEKSFACGMQGNISKPIIIDTFYDEVFQALNSKKAVLNAIPLSQSEESNIGEEFEELAISIGLKNSKQDKELYKSILIDFKAMHINSSSVVEELCNDEYFKEAISLVTEVKDIALNIGAYNLCESAAVMEYELEKGVSGNWKKLISYYNRSVSQVFEKIDAYLKKVSV